MKQNITNSSLTDWWKGLLPELIEETLVITNLIIKTIQAHGANRLIVMRLPKGELNEEGVINFDRAITLANRLGEHGVLFTVLNNHYKQKLNWAQSLESPLLVEELGENYEQNKVLSELRIHNISIEDLSENLLFRLGNADVIKELSEVKKDLERERKLKDKPLGIFSMPEIYYNQESGVGCVNDKRFKFKDDQPEYKVFAALYGEINKKLLRSQVLLLMESDKTSSKKDETYEINELVTEIRKRTGLNIDQLVNNNGNLTLVGRKVKEPS